MRGPVLVTLLGCAGMAGGEAVCFRSVEEAVHRSGVVDGSGFRMEGTAWDVFQGTGWARVRDCAHPERPVLLVRGAVGQKSPEARRNVGAADGGAELQATVRAGAMVTVMSTGRQVRMEFQGRAAESGGIGDQVRVRVGAGDAERMVLCVVKSANVLEVIQ